MSGRWRAVDAPEPLSVVLERHADVATLVLEGDLDLAGTEAFERAMKRLEDSRPRRVVIDLSRLSFMDSSGLRSLFAAERRCRRGDLRLSLVPGPRAVQRMFELTHTDRAFSFSR